MRPSNTCGSLLLSAARQQVSANKRLYISVKDTIDVAHFRLGSMILHHAIGLQYVRANLRSEVDIEFGIFNLLRLGTLLLHLVFVKLRAQHAHRALAVLVLRAFVLAVRDQPGGNMRDAHGGIGRVDVLTSLTARPVRIDANVFRLDDDFNAVVDLRRHEHAGERRMASLGLIERRYADKAMHTDLTL